MGKRSSSPQIMFLPQQQQTQSTTTNQLPQWVQQAGFDNYRAAANMPAEAFAAYEGQRVAPMNAGQLSAIDAMNANVGASDAAYQTAANNAANAVNQGNAYLSGAARGIAGSLNPMGVQRSIAGMQAAAMPTYRDVAGNVSFQPIDYSGGFQTVNASGQNYTPINAQSGFREVTGPAQGFTPISLSGAPSQINTGGMGFQSVGAGPNPTRNAQSVISRALGSADPAIDAAMLGTIGAAAQANRVGDVSSRDVNAQTLPQGDLNAYMNPFTEGVINSSIASLDSQRMADINRNADAAISANAFGGSRAAIQDAVTNAQYGRNAAQLAANLRSQNFTQAQAALQADQARNFQAQQANQSAAMQAALANQQMGLNRANVGLEAAQQLGGLGLNALSGRAQAASTLGNLGLEANAQNLQAQQANQQAGLTNQAQILNALQSNQSAGLQGLGLNLQASQANQQAEIERARLGQAAQLANQDAFLSANQQAINAQQANAGLSLDNARLNQAASLANQSAGLQSRQLDIGAQQQNAGLSLDAARLNQAAQLANQNAALQGQQNRIAALQNAGQLGLGLGNLNLSGFGQIGDIGQTMGSLGLTGAQMQGALTEQQQRDYLNSINAAFQGSGALQAQQQNELLAQQQAFEDQQAALLGPLNLRMNALGMTPYNTSQSSSGSSSGFQSQLYQPTSSSPLMGALGTGLAGLAAFKTGGLSNALLGGAGLLGFSGPLPRAINTASR